MRKTKVKIWIIATVILVVGLSALYLLPELTANDSVSEPAMSNSDSNLDLGITYLTVTSGISSYYELGVDSGALVTKVTSGSLAEQAGVQIGDVILSFNGTLVERETPLFGMMRSCQAGHEVSMELWTSGGNKTIEFTHMSNSMH